MVLDKNKTYKNLKKKGFIDSVNHSGDHKYLEYFADGKLILYTKISHGSVKDLDDYLIRQMSSQCKLTKQQFLDLANCPLSSEDYLKILKEKGELE
jgi:hypothetical protein